MRIRDATTLIGPAVNQTLQQLDLADEDQAATQLAVRYATAIDEADDPTDTLNQLGPKLLAVLEQLGATPKARAQITKGTPAGGTNRIAALHAAR